MSQKGHILFHDFKLVAWHFIYVTLNVWALQVSTLSSASQSVT